MAKNDQDGRSLEEQLASLDALSNKSAPEPPHGEAAEDPGGAAEASPQTDAGNSTDETQEAFPANPWLNNPPPPYGEQQPGAYAPAPPAPAEQAQATPAPQPGVQMPPPGYLPQPDYQPDYGAPQQPQYLPANFYPAAPPAGSGQPPPLEALPEYAPQQDGRNAPEAQQSYPWSGPAYEPPQGEAPGVPAPYSPQPPQAPGLPVPYVPQASGLPVPYVPQPSQGEVTYAQPPQGGAPGVPGPYAPQYGEVPGPATPYGQSPQGGAPGVPGPYAPQYGEVPGPATPYAQPPQGGAPGLPAPYAPQPAPGEVPGVYGPAQHQQQVPPPVPGMAQPPAPPVPQTSDSLNADTLLRNRRSAPAGGWRRAIYKATAGAIHPGEAPHEMRRRELVARARTPVAGGHHRVAVMSLKGGVGKTTTTVGLGASLASLRGDRVVAVDANPDRGTLSDKVRLETAATVRDLLNERDRIQRYADVRAFTSQASSRLEVLASDRDPAASEAFSEADYRAVTRVLEHYYSICLTDCGTGLLHSAMSGVLALANQLVLVSSPSVDGARSASATLDWLEAHGHGDLVRGGVVVLSMVRSRSKSTVDLDRLQQHFESRCRAVVRIPYDPHLEEGAEVELDQLAPATMDAYLVLAATIGDGFAWPR